MRRSWARIESLSHGVALLELVAWKLEPGRERTEGFEMLRRIRDRFASEIVGLVSCEFDAARTAAAYLNSRKDLEVRR